MGGDGHAGGAEVVTMPWACTGGWFLGPALSWDSPHKQALGLSNNLPLSLPYAAGWKLKKDFKSPACLS